MVLIVMEVQLLFGKERGQRGALERQGRLLERHFLVSFGLRALRFGGQERPAQGKTDSQGRRSGHKFSSFHLDFLDGKCRTTRRREKA